MPLPGNTRIPPGLRDTTMDQLRTLVAVYEEGSALAAARLLGREQSSVQKQLDTMNRNLGELCGEPLLLKGGRGERVRFTTAGETLVGVARRTLGDWTEGLRAARAGAGFSLSVGSTRYTLGYLLNAVERMDGQFNRDGVELRMKHVRTHSLLHQLRSRELDIVCGSVLLSEAEEGELDDVDVMEWRRSGLALVTNLADEELPAVPVTVRGLPHTPLVLSADGLIPDFLRGWFGSGYRERLDITAEIDSVHYGFQLLRSGVLRASMLVTEGIGEAVVDGLLPEATGLRTLPLVPDLGPRQHVLVGAFARSGEREAHGPTHPLSALWEALAGESSRYRASFPGLPADGASNAAPPTPTTEDRRGGGAESDDRATPERPNAHGRCEDAAPGGRTAPGGLRTAAGEPRSRISTR